MGEEALHLRARLAVLELGAVPALDALDAEALAWPSLRATTDKYLDWLPTEIAAVSPSPPVAPDGVEVDRKPEAPGAPEVTVRTSDRPALAPLRAVAAAAGLEVRADDATLTLLAAPAGAVEVERLALNDLLASLCEAAGVAWGVRGETLLLTRGAHAAGADATADALRRVLAAAPEHPAAGATRVTLANLDSRAGRTRSAARGYKQVHEVVGNAPEATFAAYNLGLLELKEGNRNAARSRFLEVIDRRPDTRWADLGWCWVARTHLDADDLPSARHAYQSALDGKTPEAKSAAALGLCVCDLLEDGDPTARLRDTRFSSRESHAVLAAFFEALVRHRAAPTESRRELLLTALDATDAARTLGPAGLYLAGRVYGELGLAQRRSPCTTRRPTPPPARSRCA